MWWQSADEIKLVSFPISLLSSVCAFLMAFTLAAFPVTLSVESVENVTSLFSFFTFMPLLLLLLSLFEFSSLFLYPR
jgi:hypothetical protein